MSILVNKPLLVSATLPGKPSESSHGIFRRLDLFVDAIKMTSGSFNVLFYVPDHINTSPENTKQVEALLRERWETEIGVTLSHRSRILASRNFWNRHVHPALSFHNIPEYLETSGKDQIQAFESCLDSAPPYIFVHRLRCMPPLLLTRRKLPPVFFDMDDIEHIAFRRSIDMPPKWKSKWLLKLQIPALISGERQSMHVASKTFVCSSLDKAALGNFGQDDRIEVIPNAVRIPERTPLPQVHRLMILGQYKYEPNRIGAEFFIEQVWPHVISTIPDAVLVVAGAAPESIRHFENPPRGVEFTGFADDLDSLYNSIRVVVCPILSGGGTRVKLIEAAAFGKPIVSTTIGAEGLEIEDGKHALLRDDPQSMAKACVTILTDDALANSLAKASHKLAEENYQRSTVTQKISKIFSAIEHISPQKNIQ